MAASNALFDLIAALARKRYRLAEREFAQIGLNHTEARLISLLVAKDGRTQDDLSAAMIIDRSNVGRALKALEDRGYLVRKKSPEDKRTSLVFLTTKGRQLSKTIAQAKRRMIAAFSAQITPKEAEAAVAVLSKMFAPGEEPLL